MAARSYFTVGDASFVVEGGGAATPHVPPALPLADADPAFAQALAGLDAPLLWTLHDDGARARVTALEAAFARVPLFAPSGKAPLAPASAERLASLVDEHAPALTRTKGAKKPKKQPALAIALVGDLELAALALAAHGHTCTVVVERDDAWSALLRAEGVAVVVQDLREPLAPALHAAFDLCLVDLATATDGYIALLSRALALVDEGSSIGVVSHPRLRDKAIPALTDVLPVDDDPALFVDFLPRVLPGPVKMGEHWDLIVFTRDDDALPLAADARCSRATALDLDPDLHVMLAEEIHGLSRALTAEDLSRALALLPSIGVDARSLDATDDADGLRRHLALDEGGFLDVHARAADGLVTLCLGGYLPRTFQAIGMALLATLPPRQSTVDLRRT